MRGTTYREDARLAGLSNEIGNSELLDSGENVVYPQSLKNRRSAINAIQ
jgi:hypothetical protein